MQTVKIMLTGIVFMLLSIFFIVADSGRGSIFGGAGFVVAIVGAIVFVVGLIRKDQR